MLASSCSNQMISSFPFMTSLDENQNPTSSSTLDQQHHSPPSSQLIDFYNFNYNNNPFLDEELILGHIWYSQKQQFDGTNVAPEEAGVELCGNEEKKVSKKQQKRPSCRKRSGGASKDRHSKICTSKGPRDRRMRLSLEIARSFFDLQDMLGFDKASKTVEWLFTKSRSAIKELKDKCSTSNDDSKSRSCNNFSVFDQEEVHREIKKRRKLRVVDKESRRMARARARERTRDKMILRNFEKSKLLGDSEANPIGVSRETCSAQVQVPGSVVCHLRV